MVDRSQASDTSRWSGEIGLLEAGGYLIISAIIILEDL